VKILVVHRYMVDIFEKPELRLARVSLPEFRFGITGNRRFSGSCTASATTRGPFRSAQADLFMGQKLSVFLVFFVVI